MRCAGILSFRTAAEQKVVVGHLVLFHKIDRQAVYIHMAHLHIAPQQLPESQTDGRRMQGQQGVSLFRHHRKSIEQKLPGSFKLQVVIMHLQSVALFHLGNLLLHQSVQDTVAENPQSPCQQKEQQQQACTRVNQYPFHKISVYATKVKNICIKRF